MFIGLLTLLLVLGFEIWYTSKTDRGMQKKYMFLKWNNIIFFICNLKEAEIENTEVVIFRVPLGMSLILRDEIG